MDILDKIKKENDIKKINKKDYDILASNIREFLIEKVSHTGGHLASNLGVVELTMALHLCMNFPCDKLIFDVGHQAYTHKLLTGRRDMFDEMRSFGGMSGFPKRAESECDVFNTGHSSTSISAAMGYAVARDMQGKKERVAAVIGDGSMTGGMAYEALNSLAQLKTGLVIVLNDNEMSIDKNVGGMSKYLNSIRVGAAYNGFKTGVESSLLTTRTGERVARTLKRSKDNIKHFFVPGTFFEELGLTYVGPIDGHNIKEMVSTFEKAFCLNKPIIIHVKTKKGYGYGFAERHPDYFHGVSPFNIETGKQLAEKKKASYTDVFAKKLLELGREHENLVAITAAMSIGTGVNKFGREFPDRMFDVGIAEQHGVTFAAGLAAAGLVPFVAIYSSFLQRAYDQILHDVCMQKLHVIFAIDRSGLVGEDGETHQGIYDISYLMHMPNMVLMAPKNRYELMDMLDFAYSYDGPIAIKYPRGDAYTGLKEYREPISLGKNELIYEGKKVAIFACGSMVSEAKRLVEMLKEDGISPMLVNVRFLTDIDCEMFEKARTNADILVTMEENIKKGGYGELFASKLASAARTRKKYIHLNCSIEDGIVPHGEVSVLKSKLGIDAKSIFDRIKEVL